MLVIHLNGAIYATLSRMHNSLKMSGGDDASKFSEEYSNGHIADGMQDINSPEPLREVGYKKLVGTKTEQKPNEERA